MLTNVVLKTGEARRGLVFNAVESLGDEFCQRCKNANQIFIKVNLVDHEKQLASTHVDAVRGLLDYIRTHAQTPVVIADAGYTGTKAAFRHFGYERLHDGYENIRLVDLNNDDVVDGFTLKRDGLKNTIRRSKIASEADFRISLTPMKIDSETGVSLTVKNWALGTWIVPSRISASGRVWARWPWLHEEGDEAHHQSIASLFEQVPCHVGIVDGFHAMEGEGPVQGTVVEMRAVLAGFDPVAVDTVATTMMGIDPTDVGYLTMCEEKKLGTMDMSKIDVPPMLLSQTTKQFERPVDFDERIASWRQEA